MGEPVIASYPAERATPNAVVFQIRPGLSIVPGIDGRAMLEGSPADSSAGALLRRRPPGSIRPVFGPFAHPDLAKALGLDRYFVLDLEPGLPAATFAQSLAEDSGVIASAQADPVGHHPGAAAPISADLGDPAPGILMQTNSSGSEPGLPGVSDPLFSQQWGLRNTGQVVDGQAGVAGADIEAPDAWALARGSGWVRVAVMDTGVSKTHPDLIDHLLPGRSFVTANPDDWDDGTSSHGTSVASIIGAATDNEIGMAGVSCGAGIMPVRIFNQFGIGSGTQFAAGLQWAADQGAVVVNMSLGYPTIAQVMRDALAYAQALDVFMVASTGNTPGQPVQFPGACPETLAVTATNNRDLFWNNSTTGPQVSISAPGVDVLGAWSTPSEPASYRLQNGTSMAVPHVVGVVAMVRAVNPALTAEQVGWVISTTCEDLGPPGWDSQFGYGRLNAAAAVATAIALGPTPCIGDFDLNGHINLDDVEAYIGYWLAGAPQADLTFPFGKIDADDLETFVELLLHDCSN